MNFNLNTPISEQVKAVLEINVGPYWSEHVARALGLPHPVVMSEFTSGQISNNFALALEKNYPEYFNAEEIQGNQLSRELAILRKQLGYTAWPTESESFYTEHQTYSFTVPDIAGTFTISNILAGDDGDGNEFVNFDITLHGKGEEIESRDVYSMACVYYSEEGRPAIKPVKNNTFDYFLPTGTSEKVFNVILKNGFPG